MNGLNYQTLQTILNIIKDYPSIDKVILFGSRAMGNYKSGSDIDLALCGTQLTTDTCFKVSALLNEHTLMPYRFDIINYASITNESLLEHINHEGQIIFEKQSVNNSR